MVKILIIDDEKSILDLLSVVFKKEGYTVETSLSAKTALELIDNEEFDLILTDIKLPQMSGMKILKYVKEKYPAGSRVKGKIRNITEYGAFLELEKGIDGLIHISDISWSSVKHPSEVLKKGDRVEAVVLEIDPDNKRISLGLKQLKEDPWKEIAEKYHAGDAVRGKVTKIVSFGAFVELEEGVEGLLHTSRMEKGENPISEGDVLDVQIVNVDHEQRKIGLDMPSGLGLPQAEPDNEIPDN